MLAHSDSDFNSLLAQPVTGGRLCIRNLGEGNALIGVLQLPPAMVPIEGAAYLLMENRQQLLLAPTPLDQGVPEWLRNETMPELMQAAIWTKTTTRDSRVVRFFPAFPESNHWMAFGPQLHEGQKNLPSHQWFDVNAQGEKKAIEAPVEGNGLALGQLLTMCPVWPNAEGTLHTLSQSPSDLRTRFYRYHHLLARSVNDPNLDARLETVIRDDPALVGLNVGRIDRAFCAYLAQLKAQGLLIMDAPQSAESFERHKAASDRIIRGEISDESVISDSVRTSNRRRSP